MPMLRIGDLEAHVPIIQGGMGVGISLSGLAIAVANAGGIGVIATAGIGQFEPDCDTNLRAANSRALKKMVRTVKTTVVLMLKNISLTLFLHTLYTAM